MAYQTHLGLFYALEIKELQILYIYVYIFCLNFLRVFY